MTGKSGYSICSERIVHSYDYLNNFLTFSFYFRNGRELFLRQNQQLFR